MGTNEAESQHLKYYADHEYLLSHKYWKLEEYSLSLVLDMHARTPVAPLVTIRAIRIEFKNSVFATGSGFHIPIEEEVNPSNAQNRSLNLIFRIK